ncbi:MAG: hypothetical protein J6328_04590 [Bacilli bacterium]|nr:hypothetical protein [Bacilli bacterium]
MKEAEKIFDDLAKVANVNFPENDSTCEKYYQKEEEVKSIDSALNKKKILKGILLFLAVVSFLAAVSGLIGLFNDWGLPISLALLLGGLAVGVILLLVVFLKVNPAIKNVEATLNELRKEAAEIKKEATSQMAPLNEMFDWNIAQKAISKAIPLLQLDDNFDVRKYKYLVDKYGFEENDDDDVSTVFVQSGSILGNPFLIERDYCMRMIKKAYTGSITIHWTTTYTDKNGTHTVSHSQTLEATTYHPAPEYSYLTYLTYANEAAPKLVFSREPTVRDGSNEKAIAKQVKKGTKEAEKLVKKSAMDDDPHDLQLMANNEFEVLWNGLDRNDEVQYRLLFTPLAQNNILKLLKGGDPYGDDFSFYKDKKINTIISAHDQNLDIYGNPVSFEGFDNRKMKQGLIDYVDAYFKAIFFDFAPLLSIPLYQQQKPAEYIYGHEFETNVNVYEHESLANSFEDDYFAPEGAITPSILKTEFISKAGDFDRVEVTSHAFQGFPEVDYVDKLGGDGHMHTIPVRWTRYEPISRVRNMETINVDTTRFGFRNLAKNQGFQNFLGAISKSPACIYQRKLMAILEDYVPDDGARNSFMEAIGRGEGKKVIDPNSKEGQKTLADLMKEKAKK